MYTLHSVEHGIVMHVQMAECTFSAQLSQSVYLMQCVWTISVYCVYSSGFSSLVWITVKSSHMFPLEQVSTETII